MMYVMICVMMYVMIYVMIFINCNSVSTRWQRSVNLYKNRKLTARKEKQHIRQCKSTEYTKYKTNIKNKNTNIKNNIKNGLSRTIQAFILLPTAQMT